MNIFNPGSLNLLAHRDGNILFKKESNWKNTFHLHLLVANTTHWMLLKHINASSHYAFVSELGLLIAVTYFEKYM